MSKQPKGEPSLSPPLPSVPASPRETLLKAVQEPRVAEEITVALKISGGLPSQAYRFEFRASGKGEVHCEMASEPTSRQAKAKAQKLEGKQFTALLKNLLASGVLEIPQEPPSFLPDTLVGRLEISDGKSVHRIFFAADPDQASVQDKVPRPEVLKAVDSIYALASKVTGTRSIKP
ncbi:MAG TPA: hypothetical protein VFO63_17665 [Blastocatellia bacterium]|nr:hypothetical protein [Blastocatellia bacterium]